MSIRWTDDQLKAVGWTGTGFGNRRRVFEAPDGSLVDSRGEFVDKIGRKQGPAAPDQRRTKAKAVADLPGTPKAKREPGTSQSAASRLRKIEREASRDLFINRCVAYGLPAPIAEHIFHPGRLFRWDFCWVSQRVAIEVQGGLWSKGHAKAAHALPLGILRDYEKSNLGQEHGWTVLFFTPDQLRVALPQIKRVLLGRPR
jgi:hypothetical protein